MQGTTILFVCPDNTFFSLIAEAYLNAESKGVMRAFSAGHVPGSSIHPAAGKLLKSVQIGSDTLSPKSVEFFMFPHAPVPDRVIYLAGAEMIERPEHWRKKVVYNVWPVGLREDGSLFMTADSFRDIRDRVSELLYPLSDNSNRRLAS